MFLKDMYHKLHVDHHPNPKMQFYFSKENIETRAIRNLLNFSDVVFQEAEISEEEAESKQIFSRYKVNDKNEIQLPVLIVNG